MRGVDFNIPAVLSNTIGGGLFVGAIYWYLYLTGPGSENISFDLGGLDTAMEAGGPMGPSRRPNFQTSADKNDGKVMHETKPGEGHPNHLSSLPSSDQQMASGIGRELSAERYTHKKGEPSLIEGQSIWCCRTLSHIRWLF